MRTMKNQCRLAFYDKYICTKDKPMENQLANELFNIIKGSGYKVKLFTEEGQKTTNVDEATRFYAYDNDLMLTLRTEDNQTEVVVQAGSDFDVTKNKILNKSINLKIPVTLFHGKKDDVVPVNYSRKIHINYRDVCHIC